MSTHITTVIFYFLHFGAKIDGLESKYNNVTAMFYRNYRSSCSQMFFRIGVLKNFANFTRKHLCWSLFFDKRLQHRCFLVKFAKFYEHLFSPEHLLWLLLNSKTSKSEAYLEPCQTSIIVFAKIVNS